MENRTMYNYVFKLSITRASITIGTESLYNLRFGLKYELN